MVTVKMSATTESIAESESDCVSPECREHAVASAVLLRKAQECLARGDWEKTCVYGWGAAEEIMRAVAVNWRDYGVVADDRRDLRALANALSITDPNVIKAIDQWNADYAQRGARNSWQTLDTRLDAVGWQWDDFLSSGFSAAASLLESFEDKHIIPAAVKHDIKRTARFVEQMHYWLEQPGPPDGFCQFHNR